MTPRVRAPIPKAQRAVRSDSAERLREAEAPLSAHVVDSAERPVFGLLAALGPRSAAAPGEYAFVVEAVREGYLLHYGEPRLLAVTTTTSPCSPATISTRSASSASPLWATPRRSPCSAS